MGATSFPGPSGAGAPAMGGPAPVAARERAVGPGVAFLAMLALLVAAFVASFGLALLLIGQGIIAAKDDPRATVALMMCSVPAMAALALAVVAGCCRFAGGAGLRRQCGLWWPRARAALGWTAGLLALLAAGDAVGDLAGLPSVTEWQKTTFAAVAPGAEMAWFLVTVVLLPPFWEELVFRGFLYGSWTACWHGRRCPPPPGEGAPEPLGWPAIVTGAVFPAALWTLLHWGQYPWPYLAMIFAMGLYLAACRRYTNSLWLCIFLHALNNAIATALTFLSL